MRKQSFLVSKLMLPLLILSVCIVSTGACRRQNDMSVQGIDPSVGDVRGEQQTRILGDGFNFDGTYTVYFGTKKATRVAILDDHTLQVRTPAGVGASKVDVTISSDNGTAYRIRGGYEYKDMAGSVVEKLGAVEKPGAVQAPTTPAPQKP